MSQYLPHYQEPEEKETDDAAWWDDDIDDPE